MKLKTLKSGLRTLGSSLAVSPQPERRMTGRKLQDRRYRLWCKDPHCVMCGRVTAYPGGFELDHRIPLYQGGPDTDENCQVLCAPDGCHDRKTAQDARGR